MTKARRLLAALLGLSMVGSVALTARGVPLTRQSMGSPFWPAMAASDPTATHLVVMVLDGGRPDYFGLTPLPHVDQLRQQGVQYSYAVDGILESETPAGHTTLSTGSTPRHNGILGFNWAQNDNDYSLFSPTVVRSGAMERIMTMSHVPTIASLYKARFPRARVVALSGHKYYAADPLGGPAADAIMYYQGDYQGHYVPVAIPGHVPPASVFNAKGLTVPTVHLADGVDDRLATKLAISAFRHMWPRVLLINYPEFDWPLGHVYGGPANRAKVLTMMKGFDHDLGMIEKAYARAGMLRHTLFVITSDHGMVPLTRFVDRKVITDAIVKAGTSATSASYSTGAYIWLRDSRKAETAAQNVVAKKDPSVESVYYLTWSGKTARYVRAGGTLVSGAVDAANQYLLGTMMNGHEPNLVVFCREGATFADPKTGWKADHGGSSWQSEHIPLILSGAGIRKGVVTGEPAQLDDVAPAVLRAMGVNPTGMEGQVLAEALLHPSPADWKGRVAEATQLTPLLRGLIAQDAYERSHR